MSKIHCQCLVNFSSPVSSVFSRPVSYAHRDMATPKKSKINLLISEKLALLDRIKNGETRQRIVDEKGIGMRTLERWINNETQMRKEAESSPASRKRKRTGKHGDVDEAALEWFVAVRNQK